jgi:hypothetical protein
MSTLTRALTRSTLPLLLVLCLAALSVTYAFADEAQRPLVVQIIGDPDAAVTGKFAVGTATPGNKALTVVGVIDFLGAGTVHNYFTQGGGNNMQINTNVDEANAVGDASRSQWKLVIGSSLDTFSIRRSAPGGTYDENALFFINGSTGNVGIATVDTGNGGAIPFTPQARLHVETASGNAVWGVTPGNSPSANVDTGVTGWATATSGVTIGAGGESDSTSGRGVEGYAPATSGTTYGVYGWSKSPDGRGVYGWASASTGANYGVAGRSASASGYGVYGWASAASGPTAGVLGQSDSTEGAGLSGFAPATTGFTYGVEGRSESTDGRGVHGYAPATTGSTFGVYGEGDSTAGTGVYGYARATTGFTAGVVGQSDSTQGSGLYAFTISTVGTTYGVEGRSDSTDGRGVHGYVPATSGTTYGVIGESDSTAGRGVVGLANATSGDVWGVYGETSSPGGTGVYGRVTATTGSNWGVTGSSDSPSGQGVTGFVTSTTGTNYGVVGYSASPDGYGMYSYGTMGVSGDFFASGTKSAIVETDNYGWRHLYAMESPQNWFEDFGKATLSGGEAVVSIEPMFAETVNLSQDYHVFLTPRGDCGLYVAEQTATSFTVRAMNGAACDIAFDYRIIAPRLDYEDLRLKEAESPEAVAASIPAAPALQLPDEASQPESRAPVQAR